MPKTKALLAACFAALRSHLSPFTVLNLLVPRTGYAVHRGLAFGADAPAVGPVCAPAPEARPRCTA